MVKIDKKYLNLDVITITDNGSEDNSGYLHIAPWKICEIDFEQKYFFTDIIDLKISEFVEYDNQPTIPLNSKCLNIYTASVIDPTSLNQVLVKC